MLAAPFGTPAFKRGMLSVSPAETTVRFTDSDASALQFLHALLWEMGLSADLNEHDRCVAVDPSFLQEINRRAEGYLA